MKNYNQKTLKKQDTWLHISFNSDISSELGNTVPYPQHHYIKGNKIVYCWLLDGFFETKTNVEFLNDIIARFKITFEDCQYLKRNTVDKSHINPLKLKYFQNLKSRAVQRIYEATRYDSTRDFVFWCLKLHAEMIIKEKGIFSYSDLEEFAINNFIDKAKDRSTLKAKCRNIFNWYLERNFELTSYTKKTKEEVMATRTENAILTAKKKEEKYREMIQNAITGLLADTMFRKKNGKWNGVAIANYLKIDVRTVRKHLKEIEEL